MKFSMTLQEKGDLLIQGRDLMVMFDCILQNMTGRIYIYMYLAQKIYQLQFTTFKMREEKSPHTDAISIKIPYSQ